MEIALHNQSLIPFDEYFKTRSRMRQPAWYRIPSNWALIVTFTVIMAGAGATLALIGGDNTTAPFPREERTVPCDHCRK